MVEGHVKERDKETGTEMNGSNERKCRQTKTKSVEEGRKTVREYIN